MPNAGSWPVRDFDAFASIPAGSIVFVAPFIAACASSSAGVAVMWNTYGGKNHIDLETPVVQDIYLNIFVLYRS